MSDEEKDFVEDFEVVINYGNMKKRIIFYDNDHRHAKLLIRLKHDGIKQSDFFRSVLTAYITGDERIHSLVDELIATQGKVRKSKSKRLRDSGKEKIKDFGLNDGEIENIFDLIAKEQPEL